ncbi:DUF4251 domain-containing protein [Croceivirga radicis]|uniref:DUF4251 domain-containing protein n=1 Tax=Croceivirga radicis TaxID=1929488 RepID=UPI000255AF5F|nr:DUF4251 domain-containing protein [Croceivirga radicis]
MKKIFAFLFLATLVLAGCKAVKDSNSLTFNPELKTSLENAHFKFEAKEIQPLTTTALTAVTNSGLIPPGSSPSRIVINGGSNFLIVKNDTLTVDLPYYGERQFGGAYNAETAGIKVEKALSTINLEYVPKKNTFVFSFKANGVDGEGFDFRGTVFTNGNANLQVYSSYRNTIAYSGKIDTLDE